MHYAPWVARPKMVTTRLLPSQVSAMHVPGVSENGTGPNVHTASSARSRRPHPRLISGSGFFVGRRRAQVAFHDELAALAGQAAKFHYSDVFGHFDLAALLGIQAAGTQVYVCGLGPMCKQLMRRRKPSVGTVRASEARSFTVILLMLINDDSGGLRVRFFPEYEHGLCPRTETFAPRPLHENA